MACSLHPVVDRESVPFVPARVSSRTGLVPRTLFNAARYEGSDADERRLFYVAGHAGARLGVHLAS